MPFVSAFCLLPFAFGDRRDERARRSTLPRQVLFASLIGTTIEFFDFYIYATAAVLVFPRLFFPADRSGVSHARLSRDVRHRLHRAADWVGAVRPLRRSHRPQDDAGGGAADDGDFDRADWRPADLPDHRHCRAVAAVAVPIRPGHRPGRRVGRRRAARHRERAAREARVVRHVPAAWRANRVRVLWQRVSAADLDADRRAVLQLRLAHSVSVERSAGPARLCTCG